MRLALCLSGQPRSYKKAHEYLNRNLLETYDVDVFMHTWKPKDTSKRLQVYNGLNRLYSPTAFSFDSELPQSTNSDMFVQNASHPANFCTSMFYSIYKSNDLRVAHELLTGNRYDFVIRSRFDLALNKCIDFQSLERGKIYVSRDVEDDTNVLLNDQFAIADTDTMNIYASTFLFLRKYYERGVSFCGHAMLEEHLKMFSIDVVRLDINHPFVDGDFNRGKHSIIREDMAQWVDTKIWGY